MLAQARAELPNECCGLLAGNKGTDGTARVVRRYPLVNEAASPTAFLCLEDKSLFAALRDMREAGLEELAVYHSHPTSEPLPSRADRERSEWWRGVMHFIISLQAPTPRVRAWWLTADDSREGQWSLLDG